jgi:hypothetical protein
LARNKINIRQRLIFKDISQLFYGWITDRIYTKRNIIISIEGYGGLGKSMSALYLATYLQQLGMQFSHENIFWTNQSALDWLSTKVNQEKFTFIKDEQVGLEQIGESSMQEQLALSSIEDIIRKPQINAIFVSINLKPHSHHFVLESLRINYETNQCMHVIKSRDGIAFGMVRTGLINDENLIKVYNEKKDEFAAKAMTQQVRNPTEKWNEIAEEFISNDLPNLRMNSKKQIQIKLMEKYGGMTSGAYQRISEIVVMKCFEKGIAWKK